MSSSSAAAVAAAVPAAGQFSEIPGLPKWDAEMFKDAYDAVTAAEAWSKMASFTGESFMFSGEPWLGNVQTHMKLMDQHSGSSYGCTMRVIEKIARDGWDAYVAEYLRYKAEKAARERERADTEEGALDARRMTRQNTA
jgi:hypothetical protein